MAHLLKTDHPHIVRLEGVCGGEPLIDGLRVTVRHVVTLHQRGEAIPDIAEALNITEAQVYHALSRCPKITSAFATEEHGKTPIFCVFQSGRLPNS